MGPKQEKMIVHNNGSSITQIKSSASPHISRASSSLSLASSSLTSVGVEDVRHLSNNYEQLLHQATASIKKLKKEKGSLESEQDRLLTVNIELATEVKRLLQLDKKNKGEREGLMKANEEFATEVTQLYEEEEKWREEKQELEQSLADTKVELNNQLESLQLQWRQEREKMESREENLVESVKMLSQDNARLIKEREEEQINQSKSHQELQLQFEEERIKLEATISCLKTELGNEIGLKRESDENVIEMSKMMERTDHQMEKLKENHLSSLKQAKDSFDKKLRSLEQKSEKLGAENFEYSIENQEINKKLSTSLAKVKTLERELGQLQVENQWLVSSQKKTSCIEGKMEERSRELQDLRAELHTEKEKVKNLSEWKSQLADKNKEIKEENKRLQTKIGDLEHLMNDEVTDINEAIRTINHLQHNKVPVSEYGNKKRFL